MDRATKKATADAERLWAAELDLAARQTSHHDQLAQHEATAGDQLLDAMLATEPGTPPPASGELARLRAEAEEVDAAVAVARGRRADAITAVHQAEAKALRRDADKLRTDADARQKRTDQLLADLEAHEGARYAPPPLVEAATGRTVGGQALTATDQLRAQADAAEARAATREAAPPPSAVRLRIDLGDPDVDEVVGRWVEACGPLTLSSPVATVRSWVAARLPGQLERRAGWQPGAHLGWEAAERHVAPEDLDDWRRQLVRTSPIRVDLITNLDGVADGSTITLPVLDDASAYVHALEVLADQGEDQQAAQPSPEPAAA